MHLIPVTHPISPVGFVSGHEAAKNIAGLSICNASSSQIATVREKCLAQDQNSNSAGQGLEPGRSIRIRARYPLDKHVPAGEQFKY